MVATETLGREKALKCPKRSLGLLESDQAGEICLGPGPAEQLVESSILLVVSLSRNYMQALS